MSELSYIRPGLYEHEGRLVRISKDIEGRFIDLDKFILPNEQDDADFSFSVPLTLYHKIEFIDYTAPSLWCTALYWHTYFELINGKLPEFLQIRRKEILGYTNSIIAKELYGHRASNVKLGYASLKRSDPRIREVQEIYGLLQEINLSEIPVVDFLAEKGHVSKNQDLEDFF